MYKFIVTAYTFANKRDHFVIPSLVANQCSDWIENQFLLDRVSHQNACI